jgi:hypothetical protein
LAKGVKPPNHSALVQAFRAKQAAKQSQVEQRQGEREKEKETAERELAQAVAAIVEESVLTTAEEREEGEVIDQEEKDDDKESDEPLRKRVRRVSVLDSLSSDSDFEPERSSTPLVIAPREAATHPSQRVAVVGLTDKVESLKADNKRLQTRLAKAETELALERGRAKAGSVSGEEYRRRGEELRWRERRRLHWRR